MHQDRYNQIRITSDYNIFKFVSQGRHGDIVKIVSFDEVIGLDNIFNLALGTMLPNGEADYATISNNGDRNKLLATVVEIVGIFFEHHPHKSVYITGSDNRRTLLYQRAIAYGFEELILKYNIYGDVSVYSPITEFEPFDKAKIYSGFLIERK